MTFRFTKIKGKPDSHIAIGYWVEGHSADWPAEGKAAWLEPVNRTSLNERFDFFRTTKVDEVELRGFSGCRIITKNSTWIVEKIGP